MSGAQAVVEILIAYGVKVVFGVPGDTSLPLYDAFYKKSSKIKHILARDERSAVFMADAYSRLTHKPAVCECPSGAGALYSIPGIAEANASSIPVILLTSGVALAGENKGIITELDHHKLFEPVTKWSSFLKHTKKIPDTLRRAFRIATTGRPGAVHLSFPVEVMKGRMNKEKMNIYCETDCMSYPAYRTRGDADRIKQLATHLDEAKRPVIIAGGGSVHSRAGELIIKIAELMSIPVATTISGQGIMPDDHPLAIGVVGDNGFHPHAHEAVDGADTLVYLGCKMGSVSTIKWTKPSPDSNTKIIQVDIDPVMLSNNYKNEVCIAGDVFLVLKDLYQELQDMDCHSDNTPWSRQINRSRKTFWQDSTAQLHSNAIPIKPQRVINAVNESLLEPLIVISDAGTPTPYITRFLRLKGKGSRFIIPRAFGGLGYAIPAVVGAFLARPDAKIIGMFGDGSLGMSAGELETLARLNVQSILIHFNNGSFGWIKALQSIHSQGRFMSVDFTQRNMADVATAFGIKSFHVKTPDELDHALNEALEHHGPVFIDVVTEPEVSELPPVYSWHHKN
ncbi:MAG: thiamine pyrophosphate-binding protein [Deltaproteobacteria bacterium]|nr:thiamine pyrophosphate-binding protein [Deltaproteobacteria bacterium]